MHNSISFYSLAYDLIPSLCSFVSVIVFFFIFSVNIYETNSFIFSSYDLELPAQKAVRIVYLPFIYFGSNVPAQVHLNRFGFPFKISI